VNLELAASTENALVSELWLTELNMRSLMRNICQARPKLTGTNTSDHVKASLLLTPSTGPMTERELFTSVLEDSKGISLITEEVEATLPVNTLYLQRMELLLTLKHTLPNVDGIETATSTAQREEELRNSLQVTLLQEMLGD
jgi:hypothetical protein